MSDTVFDPLINHERSQVLSNQYLFRSELLTKMDKMTGEALDLQGLINGLNQSSSLVGIAQSLDELSSITQSILSKPEILRGDFKFQNGAIDAGGDPQEIAPISEQRTYFFALNTSRESLMLQFGGSASEVDGILLKPGGHFEFPAHVISIGAASIFGRVTGQSFVWMEA